MNTMHQKIQQNYATMDKAKLMSLDDQKLSGEARPLFLAELVKRGIPYEEYKEIHIRTLDETKTAQKAYDRRLKRRSFLDIKLFALAAVYVPIAYYIMNRMDFHTLIIVMFSMVVAICLAYISNIIYWTARATLGKQKPSPLFNSVFVFFLTVFFLVCVTLVRLYMNSQGRDTIAESLLAMLLITIGFVADWLTHLIRAKHKP